MLLTHTYLEGVAVIEPKVYGDHRGWFMETYSEASLAQYGINLQFIQDNHSFSAVKGTLRGMHYQLHPKSQAKIVRCSKGAIYDVAVDIRKGSPTYGQWVGIELSADNKKQLLIPRGYAHGFITLTEDVEVQYKADQFYAPDYDRGFLWSDPDVAIKWPSAAEPVLSAKDEKAPLLKDAENNFRYGE